MKAKNSKSGFTIIEVVLVLAIAGLIFLMVFIALPALQRSQRDTQRRDDLAMFATGITNYQTNNRGQVPTTKAKWKEFFTTYMKSNAYQDANTQNATTGNDTKVVNVNPNNSEFYDPNGPNYVFVYNASVTTANNVPWNWTTTALTAGTEPITTNDNTLTGYTIRIWGKAKCNGESIVSDASTRSVAYKYRLEGAGFYCNDNV